jgi:hypothetical protein
MFFIWCNKDKSAYVVAGGLTKEEELAFEILGWTKVRKLEAPTEEAAKKEFVNWCEEQQPGNRIEKVPQLTLKKEMLRKSR